MDSPHHSSQISSEAANAIDRGLDRLNQLVSDDGRWYCYRYVVESPDKWREEQNPFVGALGTIYISHLDDARVKSIVRRTLRRTLEVMEPHCLWRYWDFLPPDADSTSVCNVALGPHPVLFGGWYEQHLLKNRDDQGRFQVWLRPGQPNDADAIVNANVTACLGDNEGTRAAQSWLIQIIRDGVEREEIHYYWDSMDLFYAVARAHLLHPSLYTEILPVIIDRIRRRRNEDGSYGDGLRTALAVTTLHMLGKPLSGTEAEATARNLISLQQADGEWPASRLSSGPEWPAPRMYAFLSPAFEAAACVVALDHLREQ